MTIASYVIDRASRRSGDINNKIFTVAEKLEELDEILLEVVSKTACYKRQEDIQIQDGARTYQFPGDMLELRQMTVEVVDGELVFASSYEALINEGTPFHSTGTLGSLWHAPLSEGSRAITPSVSKIFFRDLVNHNEFMFDPILKTNNIQPRAKINLGFGGLPELDPDGGLIEINEIVEADDTPNSAVQYDIWIDTGDQDRPRAVYLAEEAYSVAQATLTIPGANRPGGATALVFTAIPVGSLGDYIDIVITNAGPTGTSTLVKTGTGTRYDHYVYTFNMFVSDSSNNSIITLLSGDAHLVASGASAVNAAFTAYTATSLDSGLFAMWRPVTIRLVFVSRLPPLTAETDELHPSIPLDVVQKLPDKLAAVLLEMGLEEGGDRNQIDRFNKNFDDAVARAFRHRSTVSGFGASPG